MGSSRLAACLTGDTALHLIVIFACIGAGAVVLGILFRATNFDGN